MTQQFPYFSQHHWQVFDDAQHEVSISADAALAYQDSFIRWIPDLQQTPTGIVHFYPLHQPTILLGAKDTRLPQLTRATRFLQEKGYALSLRSHGGLAVVCDEGVLNIGIASDLEQFPLSIDAAYEQMVTLIRQALAPYQLAVEAYEIADSYCPGTYDLVVNQRKIGGIAQRRFKTGITTAAYISVCGDQAQRANLIRDYYQLGEADDSYPNVQASVMATISDFLDAPITLHSFKARIVETLQSLSTTSVGNYQHANLQAIFDKMLPVVQQRSQTIRT